MTSDAKIEANRLNAQKSTGPKTSGGKSRSRANAVKHGFNAKSVLLPGESPKEFEALRNSLIEEYEPNSAVRKCLVDHLADLLWQLQRIPKFRRAITKNALEDAVASAAGDKRPRPGQALGRALPALLDRGHFDQLSGQALRLTKQIEIVLGQLPADKASKPTHVQILTFSESEKILEDQHRQAENQSQKP